MTHDDDQTPVDDREGEETTERRDKAGAGSGTVSEGGSGALNPDTSLGGADSVPDTPDVNTAVSDEVSAEEPGRDG
ncbi:hypothetical protein ACQE98_10265 [Ornithinimicrobium sp. W1679]|uniref:hypothetical protein n=1 Tax=Ornithinimicrobium sp. W1679 TaxID=3418770 RepID=UPI003CFAFEBB